MTWKEKETVKADWVSWEGINCSGETDLLWSEEKTKDTINTQTVKQIIKMSYLKRKILLGARYLLMYLQKPLLPSNK